MNRLKNRELMPQRLTTCLCPTQHFQVCMTHPGSIKESIFYMHLDCFMPKIIQILNGFRLLYTQDNRPPQCIVQRHCFSLSSPNPGAAVTRSGRASTEFEQVGLITTITLAYRGVDIQELGRHGFTALIKFIQIKP